MHSQTLADLNLNIVDVTQTILNDYFTMMMVLESQEKVDFKTIREQLDQTADQLGVDIRIQNAEIFDAMHKL